MRLGAEQRGFPIFSNGLKPSWISSTEVVISLLGRRSMRLMPAAPHASSEHRGDKLPGEPLLRRLQSTGGTEGSEATDVVGWSRMSASLSGGPSRTLEQLVLPRKSSWR